MSRLPVLSTAAGFVDPVYLDELGEITGLHLVHGPNGPQAASWTIDLDVRSNHRALQPGRWIYSLAGTELVWAGRLSTPGRAVPWQMQATGISAEGNNFKAYAPTSGNQLKGNEVVDAAISRGLLWTRGVSLPNLTQDTSDASGSGSVSDTLTTLGDANGKVWFVDPAGNLTLPVIPAAVTVMLLASDPAGGRTLDSYVTTLLVVYNDSTSLVQETVVVTDPDAADEFGSIEDVLDLTGEDYMSAAAATTRGTTKLAQLTPRAGFVNPFTFSRGQVLTAGGVELDLAALDCLDYGRVLQLDPDVAGELDPTTATEIRFTELDYDVDADTIAVTPFDSPAQDVLLSNGRIMATT